MANQQQTSPTSASGTRANGGERGLNKCLFIGRLGADPEMRYTTNGIAVTTGSLAVKSYPRAERPDWIRLRFWRGAAETMNQHARKGSKLHVEGKLRVNTRADGQGIVRTYFVVDVDEFMFLGDPGQRAASGAGAEDDADLAGLDEIV